MEFPSIVEGTFLWYWYHSLTGLNGMVLSLMVAGLVVGFTRWTPLRSTIKALVSIGFMATLPLGLLKLGFAIPKSDPDLITYLSFSGTILAIGVGVPYLFHQTLRAASGLYSTYIGKTVQYPEASPQGKVDQADETVKMESEVRETDTEVLAESNPGAKITFSGTGRTAHLGVRETTIGRASDNDIVVDDPTVSRYHAKVTQGTNGFYIEDLKSLAGTIVNGEKAKRKEIPIGATVKLGKTAMVFESPQNMPVMVHSDVTSELSPVVEAQTKTTVLKQAKPKLTWLAVANGPSAGQVHALNQGSNWIGRDLSNDLSLNDPFVSRNHAMVRLVDGKAYLLGFGSNNDTEVNGKKMELALLAPGSTIKIGETELVLMDIERPIQDKGTPSDGTTLRDTSGKRVGLLIVKAGKDAGKSYMLTSKDNVIGRSTECTIQLSDDSVSRQHAVIRHENGKFALFDLGSVGGTQLDGRPINGNLLKDRDVIMMGKSEIVLMNPQAQSTVDKLTA